MTHSRDEITCLKEEITVLKSALEHALTCPSAGKAAQLERTEPCDLMRWDKLDCSSCQSMILAKRGVL